MNRVVVKVGGHALDSLRADSSVLVDLAHDVEGLRDQMIDVVIVHGGGPQIRELLDGVGAESHFHEGLRVTSALTMGYVAMALSHVNMRITAALNTAGLSSVGLSGADDALLLATSLGEPWDRAGGVPAVRTGVVRSLWSHSITPVLSSVALDDDGDLLNVNADTAAGALAGALDADVLVLLSDIDQLRADADDPSSALESVTATQVRALIDSGSVREGMRPKMEAALDALAGGARRIIMANGTRRHALRDALTGTIPTTEVVA